MPPAAGLGFYATSHDTASARGKSSPRPSDVDDASFVDGDAEIEWYQIMRSLHHFMLASVSRAAKTPPR